MGLMSNEDISGHRIEIDRAGRTVLHAVLTNFGENSEEYRYDLDEKTCEEFFRWLERTSGIYRWKGDYTVPMMDGYAWDLTVVTEKGSKAVKGNTLPPRGGDVEKRIRALAAFEINPQIF
jgi:hypothetical protein